MQPIDPPVGGGRIRLLGLYHNLGQQFDTKYVGTYDWPGEKYRRHYLSDSLEEIDIPLSEKHFLEAEKWKERAGGKTIIDSAFHQLAVNSKEYVAEAQRFAKQADVVIFSHPWIFPLVKDYINKASQTIIYDSHNVEGYLRTMLLDDGGFGSEIAREVVRVEYELCHYADLVLACSHDDRQLFNKLYQIPFSKIKVVPNGVFSKKILPADKRDKIRLKEELGLGCEPASIFIASGYPPNVEAADFICHNLAPKLNDVQFIIAGGVGDAFDISQLHQAGIKNVKFTGHISEEDKIKYLQACDLAINPMFSGSGTNIKMFDFFAAGLPTITTATGARGIPLLSSPAYCISEQEDFAKSIRSLLNDDRQMINLSENAIGLVHEKFSWENISPKLGQIIEKHQQYLNRNKPYFSVIIPTYERHDKLSLLIDKLAGQTYKNFEVIVIDQSKEIWPEHSKNFGIDLFYHHTVVKGAVKARNSGAFLAMGEVIAFTDDDCEPNPQWLKNARSYFNRPEVVGVEGIIKSDKVGDPDYRTVSNEGFEGIGFMTANLFVRNNIFAAINGFDEIFDNPHFREDTDLGWRAGQYGEIPYAKDVAVFHPPHPRNIERESVVDRAKFFEKDALLMARHPKKYRQLFIRENHWQRDEGFWENFLFGLRKYEVDLPEKYFPNLKEWSIRKHSTR